MAEYTGLATSCYPCCKHRPCIDRWLKTGKGHCISGHGPPDPKCTDMTPVEVCRRLVNGYYTASKSARTAARDALDPRT